MPASQSTQSGEAVPTGVGRLFLNAFKGGSQYDYTALTLKQAVLLLAVPMVMEMMMESVFAVADVFWVSRLGKNAIAVVGLTESVMTLIYAIAGGMSFAASAIVARRIGEKNPGQASRAAGQVLVLGLSLSAGLGAIGALLGPVILRAMGADAQVLSIGAGFSRLMLGANLTVFMIFLLNAVFRGAGDAAMALRTLWLANLLNIALGPCFIFGLGPFPRLGVLGAAVATNLGRGTGVLYQIWHLRGRSGRVQVRLPDLWPDWKVLSGIFKTSGTGVLQLLISTTSWVGLFKILATFGSQALAAYTIAIRLITFALLPAWGLANAGATLVGQNLGAGKPDRAESSVWLALRFDVTFLGVVGAIYVIGAHFLIRLFTDDPAVLAQGARGLWIMSLAFPIYAAGMCLEGGFNGSGDTWTPTRLNFVCYWICQLPLAWFLAVPMRLGPTGVYISVAASFTLMTLWAGILFKRGKWKEQKV